MLEKCAEFFRETPRSNLDDNGVGLMSVGAFDPLRIPRVASKTGEALLSDAKADTTFYPSPSLLSFIAGTEHFLRSIAALPSPRPLVRVLRPG